MKNTNTLITAISVADEAPISVADEGSGSGSGALVKAVVTPDTTVISLPDQGSEDILKPDTTVIPLPDQESEDIVKPAVPKRQRVHKSKEEIRVNKAERYLSKQAAIEERKAEKTRFFQSFREEENGAEEEDDEEAGSGTKAKKRKIRSKLNIIAKNAAPED